MQGCMKPEFRLLVNLTGNVLGRMYVLKIPRDGLAHQIFD